MWESAFAWGAVITSVALLLVAARSHGRQIRLEREHRGHFEIDFTAENHPWAEQLWKRDRRLSWSTFAIVGPALGAGFWVEPPSVCRFRSPDSIRRSGGSRAGWWEESSGERSRRSSSREERVSHDCAACSSCR